MIDYNQAREIADAHLLEQFGPRAENPLVIHQIIQHRCGWEFRFQPLAWIESPRHWPRTGALCGAGNLTVDRRDGRIQHHGGGDGGRTKLAWHRDFDSDTGGAPSRPMGRTCGC
ncbi:hypothetical protein [Yinghuangia sp. YIM S09857]|uniref:hypothetical protein n=1 Tax=Yinghuangia sp. YIM S09857 TaxID=3436929 RepID=UPI003F533F3A